MRRVIEVFNGCENTSFLLDYLFSSLPLPLFFYRPQITQINTDFQKENKPHAEYL